MIVTFDAQLSCKDDTETKNRTVSITSINFTVKDEPDDA